jgi:GT2 family glycosyltransferase
LRKPDYLENFIMRFTSPQAGPDAQPASCSVLISILNWNSADVTLQCLESIAAMRPETGVALSVVVIDNGSREDDYQRLQQGVQRRGITLLRQDANLGFAGGHNLAIRMAMVQRADFIWLVNSDAVIDPACLGQLVALMASRPDCGAASPMVVALDDDAEIDFCGARHDWSRLETERARSVEQAHGWEHETPDTMWASGTVVMYRMAALRQIGMLDDKLFAYYEDNDIGARLAQAGWRSLVAFDARARHLRYVYDLHHRPPYYFYLMTRNSILFWRKHTPAPFRRCIRLRLLDRSLFLANILFAKSQHEKARACMLGALDGMLGRGGPPRLERRVPRLFDLLRRLLLIQHARHLATK